MVSWITFAWQIEFVAIAVFIYALVIFLRVTIKLDKEFRMAMFFILASLALNIALGIMIGVFITMEIGYDSLVNFWIIQPLAALVGAFLVMFGARKFFSALEKNNQ